MTHQVVAWLFLAPLLAAGTVQPGVSIGVYDRPRTDDTRALDHLNSAHGLGATYTVYSPDAFQVITDFAPHAVWYVGSGSGASAAGLRNNPAFQRGDGFARVVIMGFDPGNHAVNGGDPREGPSVLLRNAILWVAARQLPGLVIQADFGPFDWLPASWGVTGAVLEGADDVKLDRDQRTHPVNERLSTTRLSGWGYSRHVKLARDVPGWTTIQRTLAREPVVIVRDFCGAPDDCDGDGVGDALDNCVHGPDPTQADADGDGVGDVCDNCAAAANHDQADGDGDGTGDACQDRDGDGVLDITDNCPAAANAAQADADRDGSGDACDLCEGQDDRLDGDGDGVPEVCDNCPATFNPSQTDGDANGRGDACDDRDGDGRLDASDNCVDVPNPGQEDRDRDQVGDACDLCMDTDHDGFGNPGFATNTCPDDNCPDNANPEQSDRDGDGIGDACALCAMLGETPRFVVSAQNSLKIAPGHPFGYRYPLRVQIEGHVCTTRAWLAGITIASDLIAAATTRNAVHFRPPAYYYDTVIGGDLITGGGKVRYEPYEIIGMIDTSGNDPRVAACARGLAAAASASNALAALPPTRTFGDIVVRNGEDFELDARGGGVFNFDSLFLAGGTGLYACRYRACASLGIRINPNDNVVVNVLGQLVVGHGAYIWVNGGDQYGADAIVINVLGVRPAVRIHEVAYVEVPILAPGRTVMVIGAKNFDEQSTFVDRIWARNLRATGLTDVFPADERCGFPLY